MTSSCSTAASRRAMPYGVLGRVERFDDRLQLRDPLRRGLRPGSGGPGAPAAARCGQLDGFLEFLAGELSHPGLAGVVGNLLADPALPDGAARAARGRNAPLLRRRPARAHGRRGDARPRDGAAAPAAPRGPRPGGGAPARRRPRSRARTRPSFRPTDEGRRLLGHVHLGLRLVEGRAGGLDVGVRAELLHAIASHHDRHGTRTARPAVLYHANQLDAVAATRPVE